MDSVAFLVTTPIKVRVKSENRDSTPSRPASSTRKRYFKNHFGKLLNFLVGNTQTCYVIYSLNIWHP